MLDVIRARRSRLSSGSHFIRFYTLFTLAFPLVSFRSSSLYFSSIVPSKSLRTLSQLVLICSKCARCRSLSLFSPKLTSISWSVIARVLSLSHKEWNQCSFTRTRALSHTLGRNAFQLIWGPNKSLAHFIHQLSDDQKVANAESEAQCGQYPRFRFSSRNGRARRSVPESRRSTGVVLPASKHNLSQHGRRLGDLNLLTNLMKPDVAD